MNLKTNYNVPETTIVLSLINDKKDLILKLENLILTQEETILRRLNKWFEFFNENYYRGVCMYSQTIFAIVDASRYDDVFKTQTTHEFELSLKFYSHIFESNIFISLSELEHARFLLKLSLVFSKYPGMVSGSIKESISKLNNGSDNAALKTIFSSLYVKYENPYILTDKIDSLTNEDIDLLMYILQGNNIRNYKNIPFPISRKESFIFINELPKNISFENNLLGRAIISSKLCNTKSCDIKLLKPLLTYSKVFRYNLCDFNKDIMFWKSVFRFISRGNSAKYVSIQDYIDYFEYMKYSEAPNYSLRGRTVFSVENAISNWHESADYPKNMELISQKWHRTTEKDVKINKDKINYLFKEIINGEELFLESKKLKHCVFSYIDSCIHGHLTIWSLQKEVDTIYQPFITIEVSNNKITQVSGKYNRAINDKENKLIEEWAEMMNYKMSIEFCE